MVFMRELVLCPVFIPVASALVAQQDTARDLVVACAVLPRWRSFPQIHGFRLSFGDFCLWLGNFRTYA